MSARFKRCFANATLVIASTLLAYWVMEFAIFRLLLPVMPLQLRPMLPDVADVLTQNSKSGFLPQHYIALLGDSNAEGLGDWLWQTGGNRAKPFHSANIIHDVTGRDVVSFGRGGAGSAEGIVLRPAEIFPTSRCAVLPAIDIPDQMFVYFFAGNDMEDNVYFQDKVRARYGSIDTELIDRYLTTQYAAQNPWKCHLELLGMGIGMAQLLYDYYVAGIDLSSCGEKLGAPRANQLIVAGQTIVAPALEAPAAMMTDDEIQLSMRVLARSLVWLRQRFQGVPVSLVNIPAPLTLYHYATKEVTFCSWRIGSIDLDEAKRRNRLMKTLQRQIASDQGMDFIDAEPVLRVAAATAPIHGPRDWDHLNETGYRALGQLIASYVKARP